MPGKLAQLCAYLLHQPRRAIDHLAGGLGAQRDAAGRLRALLGKEADLVGNDGKASAVNARPSGLDSGIQREQVGLMCYGPNGSRESFDLVRSLA